MATLKYRDPADGTWKPMNAGIALDPMPSPVQTIGPPTNIITQVSPTFVPLPNPCTASITLSRAAMVRVDAGCWLAISGSQTGGVDVRAKVVGYGATTSDYGQWGEVMYAGVAASVTYGGQHWTSRVVACNAGTTTFEIYSFKTGSTGQMNVNYTILGLTPLYWIGQPGAYSAPVEPGWTAPTLLNSWVNYAAGHRQAAYRRKLDGTVEIRGLVKLGTLNTPIMTLPYAPLEQEIFHCRSNTASCRVDMFANGNLQVVSYDTGGTNAFVSLAGIHFQADG
jgi:hypothetical protein